VVEAVDVQVLADRVRLTVHAVGDADLELWGVRRKRDLFERVFGRRLEIHLAGTGDTWPGTVPTEDDGPG
jgi:hypothetical protein